MRAHKICTVYVDSLWRRIVNIFLCESSDQILTDDRVQSPALVRSRHLLPHGSQEALGVEEPGHPEYLKLKSRRRSYIFSLYKCAFFYLWPSVIAPPPELSVSLQQFRVPEAKGGRLPADLGPLIGQPGVVHGVQCRSQVVTHHDRALDR